MSTIQSSIKLNDGMTPVLRNITKAMNVMLNAFESVQKASGRAIDVQSLQYARDRIARVNAALDQMGNEAVEAGEKATRAARNTAQSTIVVINNIDKIINNTRKIKPAIDDNTRSQDRFDNSVKKTNSSIKGLLTNVNRIRNAVGVWVGSRMLGGLINTSDALTMSSARLDLMNDGMHTTAQLQNMIYESAMRSRAGYLDMAASVSKVALQAGNLFQTNGKQNNAAIVQFMENYNKMAAISGASAQQTSAAMLQIVQALSSGELRGDELRSVLENMPVVAQYVADELTRMGDGFFNTLPDKLKSMADDAKITADEILELGHEGKISAETLRNAVLNATDDLNEKIKKMNYTWAQVWVLFKNAAIKAFEPILRGINAIIKNEKFQRFAEALGNGLNYAAFIAGKAFTALGHVLGWVFDSVAAVYNFIKNNWSFIAPIIWGIVGALVVHNAILAIGLVKSAIKWAIATYNAIAYQWALFKMAVAQHGFNAALAMCPLAWFLFALIAIVVVFYLIIAAINKVCGTSISATGIIAGAFMWLGALIWNIIKLVINIFVALGITVWNILKAIANGYLLLANTVIGVCQWIVEAWNWAADNMGTIFENIGIWWDNLWIDAQIGLSYFISWALSKLASLAQKIQPLADLLDIDLSGLANASASYAAKSAKLIASRKSYKSLTAFNPNVNWSSIDYLGMTSYGDKMLGWTDMTDAYDKGYKWGENLGNKVGDFFGGLSIDKVTGYDGASGTNDFIKGITGSFNGTDPYNPSNLSNPTLDKIAKDTGNIGKNTGDTAKNTSESEEDFSFLRELAERESIQRYTLTDLKIDMTNNNNISNGVDADSMMKRLAKELSRAVLTTAEGVTPW